MFVPWFTKILMMLLMPVKVAGSCALQQCIGCGLLQTAADSVLYVLNISNGQTCHNVHVYYSCSHVF